MIQISNADFDQLIGKLHSKETFVCNADFSAKGIVYSVLIDKVVAVIRVIPKGFFEWTFVKRMQLNEVDFTAVDFFMVAADIAV